MIRIRKSKERGRADHGWLKSYHTFSFADYHDPAHTRFRTLRVINEDWVEPGKGFDPHAHQDMEILTCVLEGALEHKDSMGNTSVIRPGELQRMSAGSGVTHSEYNHSKKEIVHLLQIWVLTEARGIKPGYEQKKFPVEGKRNRLRLIASRDGREKSLTIHQDVYVYDASLEKGRDLNHAIPAERHVWIQVTRGRLRLNDMHMQAGDGAGVSEEAELRFSADEETDFLLFDLP